MMHVYKGNAHYTLRSRLIFSAIITVIVIGVMPIFTTAATSGPVLIEKDYKPNSTDKEIVLLQKFLNSHNFIIAKSGPGSPGHETTFFGLGTYRALVRFQSANGLPKSGYLGPLTRLAIKKITSPSSSVTSNTTSVTSPGASSVVPPLVPSAIQVSIDTPFSRLFSLGNGYTPGFGGGGEVAADISAPVIALSAPTNGAFVAGSSVTLSASATDDRAVIGVQFKIDGLSLGGESTASPYATIWNSTAALDGAHSVSATARDAAGNRTTSGAVSVMVDNTAPVISSIATSSTSDVASTVTWTTNEAGTSQINYGLTTAYGASTTLDATLTTSHTVALTGLTAGSRYHYRVRSTDAQGNLRVSADQSFTTAYLGQVATRTNIPFTKSVLGSTNQSMSRTFHYARDTITSIKVVIPNYSDEEVAPGSVATVRASIEYPAGTFTQLLFSGSATGTIPNGEMITSDFATVSIPNGAKFYTRIFFSSASAILWTDGKNTANGDMINYATSSIADLTMSGTITDQPAGIVFFPAAILAMTQQPSVFILGDSRAQGQNDNAADGATDLGNIARSVGPTLGYINGAHPGETFSIFSGASTQRRILAGYASHIIGDLGVNDTHAGLSAATLQTSLATFVGYFPTKTIFWTTAEAETSSTDGWATLVNQTLDSGNSQRILWNNYIRTVPAPLAGIYDIADVLESSRDSGLWGVGSPGARLTDDGVHSRVSGYQLVQSSGVVNASLIVR